MENMKLTDEMLNHVTGAGTAIVPTESAYKSGDNVRFHLDGQDYTGIITESMFYASKKAWSHCIVNASLGTRLVPEANIDGLA